MEKESKVSEETKGKDREKDSPKKSSGEQPKQSFAESFESTKVFLKDSKAELRRIHWPTFRQVMAETGVVISTVIFTILLVSAFDWGLGLVSHWLFTS